MIPRLVSLELRYSKKHREVELDQTGRVGQAISLKKAWNTTYFQKMNPKI